jgi:hypothetical protein
MNNQAPTPETDAAANESIVAVYQTSQRIERERDALRAALAEITGIPNPESGFQNPEP